MTDINSVDESVHFQIVESQLVSYTHTQAVTHQLSLNQHLY